MLTSKWKDLFRILYFVPQDCRVWTKGQTAVSQDAVLTGTGQNVPEEKGHDIITSVADLPVQFFRIHF